MQRTIPNALEKNKPLELVFFSDLLKDTNKLLRELHFVPCENSQDFYDQYLKIEQASIKQKNRQLLINHLVSLFYIYQKLSEKKYIDGILWESLDHYNLKKLFVHPLQVATFLENYIPYICLQWIKTLQNKKNFLFHFRYMGGEQSKDLIKETDLPGEIELPENYERIPMYVVLKNDNQYAIYYYRLVSSRKITEVFAGAPYGAIHRFSNHLFTDEEIHSSEDSKDFYLTIPNQRERRTFHYGPKGYLKREEHVFYMDIEKDITEIKNEIFLDHVKRFSSDSKAKDFLFFKENSLIKKTLINTIHQNSINKYINYITAKFNHHNKNCFFKLAMDWDISCVKHKLHAARKLKHSLSDKNYVPDFTSKELAALTQKDSQLNNLVIHLMQYGFLSPQVKNIIQSQQKQNRLREKNKFNEFRAFCKNHIYTPLGTLLGYTIITGDEVLSSLFETGLNGFII